jgi:outer membrane lipoprotein-sorting protein
MKNNVNKVTVMAGVLFSLVFSVAPVFAQTADAEAIIDRSRNRIQADTTSTRSRMVLTAKDGTTSERIMDQYSKDGPKGHRKIIVFQRPASVANTRFLTLENPGNNDDQWIFLPSLGKVRRIASSEGSNSFMGSDLSYDDLSAMDRQADLDTHRIIREESVAGNLCYVIESISKDNTFQYSKMVQYIDKSTYVNHKAELFDRRGTLVKVLELSELKDVQGRLTPMVTKMTTLAAGTSTSIMVDIIKYDDPMPEGVFTTVYLETGRAR